MAIVKVLGIRAEENSVSYELKKAWNEGQLNWNQAATGAPWATPSAKGTTDRVPRPPA
jgi:hypothetical protein